MSLFDLSDMGQHQIQSDSAAAAAEGYGLSIHSSKALQEVIGTLERNQHIHFMSKGEWSMHELLTYVLQQTGPAKVYITTWTITEDPVSKLFLLKQEGIIQELHCVLDYRIKDRKPKPFQFLEQTADRILLTKCHAKVTVIENEHWHVAIIGSANFSKNPRIEAGIICTEKNISQFHQSWIEAQFHEAQ
ncbi:MAG: hypothetical protein ACPGJS_00570 [Flammeovirgaceae bacterium]